MIKFNKTFMACGSLLLASSGAIAQKAGDTILAVGLTQCARIWAWA
jgi:hypothetical protein